MLRSGANAKTAAANVETFLTAMSRHLEQGKDVLYLGFSSGLSSTYKMCIRDRGKARNITCSFRAA